MHIFKVDSGISYEVPCSADNMLASIHENIRKVSGVPCCDQILIVDGVQMAQKHIQSGTAGVSKFQPVFLFNRGQLRSKDMVFSSCPSEQNIDVDAELLIHLKQDEPFFPELKSLYPLSEIPSYMETLKQHFVSGPVAE
eukprot:Sdes_comp16841_c0_seq1m6085